MVDRLAELGISDGVRDLEAGSVASGAGSGAASEQVFMNEFFAQVGAIKNKMSRIRSNVTRIDSTHAQVSDNVMDDSRLREGMEKLEMLTDETQKGCQEISKELEQMKTKNEEFEKENPNSTEMRIRANMHSTLTKKFMGLMKDFQGVQAKYKAKYKQKVERHLKIVNPNADQEDFDRLMEQNPDAGYDGSIFSLQGVEAQQQFANIQEKHRDILKLERSIEELHQLFMDMSVLVETQGELLDNIEANVSQAQGYTQKGVQELERAKELQKAARKKMCCIIVCVLIIGGSVIGGVVPNV